MFSSLQPLLVHFGWAFVLLWWICVMLPSNGWSTGILGTLPKKSSFIFLWEVVGVWRSRVWGFLCTQQRSGKCTWTLLLLLLQPPCHSSLYPKIERTKMRYLGWHFSPHKPFLGCLHAAGDPWGPQQMAPSTDRSSSTQFLFEQGKTFWLKLSYIMMRVGYPNPHIFFSRFHLLLF